MESCNGIEFINNKQPDSEPNINNNLHSNENHDSEWMYSDRDGDSDSGHHNTNRECRQ